MSFKDHFSGHAAGYRDARPHYDAAAHKLYWAKEIRFSDGPESTLNYDIRVLGRHGVLSLNAVAAMGQLQQIKTDMQEVIAFTEFSGWGGTSWDGTDQPLWALKDDFNYIHNKHTLKFGYDFQSQRANGYGQQNIMGMAAFSYLGTSVPAATSATSGGESAVAPGETIAPARAIP